MSGVMTGDIICKAVFEIIVVAVLIKEWIRLFGGAKASTEAYIYDLQPLKRQIINVILCSIVFLAWFYGNMMIKSGGISVVDAAFGCVLMGELIGVIILGSLKREQEYTEGYSEETQDVSESWDDMEGYRHGASAIDAVKDEEPDKNDNSDEAYDEEEKTDQQSYEEDIPDSENDDEGSDSEAQEEEMNFEEDAQEEVQDLPEKSRKIRRLTDISEFEKIEKEMEEKTEKENKTEETEEQKHAENMNETEFEEISDWSEE